MPLQSVYAITLSEWYGVTCAVQCTAWLAYPSLPLTNHLFTTLAFSVITVLLYNGVFFSFEIVQIKIFSFVNLQAIIYFTYSRTLQNQ